jgi:hypothetical protein
MSAQVLLWVVAMRFMVGINAIELPATAHRKLGKRCVMCGEICWSVPANGSFPTVCSRASDAGHC